MRASAINMAAVLLGATLTAGGVLDLLIPVDMVVFHHLVETSHAEIERVTPQGMQVYGVLGVVLGVALMWYAGSPMRRKAAAVERYVFDLSRDLKRRFGERQHYTIQQVTHAAREGHFSTAFIPYAHAMFCARDTFDAFYTSLQIPCDYDALRVVVGRRYFDGALGFNAATIARMAAALYDDESTFTQTAAG